MLKLAMTAVSIRISGTRHTAFTRTNQDMIYGHRRTTKKGNQDGNILDFPYFLKSRAKFESSGALSLSKRGTGIGVAFPQLHGRSARQASLLLLQRICGNFSSMAAPGRKKRSGGASIRVKLISVSDRSVVRIFFTRHEAELARGLLESSGISASVSADDYGGLQPALAFTFGVRLLVHSSDMEESLKILENNGFIDSPSE